MASFLIHLVLCTMLVPGLTQDTSIVNDMNKGDPCYFAYQLFQQLAILQQNLIDVVGILSDDIKEVKEEVTKLSGDFNADIREVKDEVTKLTGLPEEVKYLSGSIRGLQNDVRQLNDSIGEVKEDISIISGDFNAVKGDVANISKDIIQVQDGVTELSDELKDYTTQSDELRDKNQEQLGQFIDEVKTFIQMNMSSKQDISEINTNLAQQVTPMSNLLQTVYKDLRTKLNNTGEVIDELRDIFIEHENDQKNLTHNVQDIASHISSFTDTVKEVRREVAGILEEHIETRFMIMRDITDIQEAIQETKTNLLNKSHELNLTLNTVYINTVHLKDTVNMTHHKLDVISQQIQTDPSEDPNDAQCPCINDNTQCTHNKDIMIQNHKEVLEALDRIQNSTLHEVSSINGSCTVIVPGDTGEHHELLTAVGRMNHTLRNISSMQSTVKVRSYLQILIHVFRKLVLFLLLVFKVHNNEMNI